MSNLQNSGFEQRFCRRIEQPGSEPRPDDRDPLLGGQVHEPRVTLRTNESLDDQEDGLHPQCDRQVCFDLKFVLSFKFVLM